MSTQETTPPICQHEQCEGTHRKIGAQRSHSASLACDPRAVVDLDLAKHTCGTMKPNQDFRREEISFASRRQSSKSGGVVQLDAVHVMHRQAKAALSTLE